jgi:hypothetical protein
MNKRPRLTSRVDDCFFKTPATAALEAILSLDDFECQEDFPVFFDAIIASRQAKQVHQTHKKSSTMASVTCHFSRLSTTA